MPIYEFKCKNCDNRFEKLCAMSAEGNGISCPECEGMDVKRLMSAFFSSSKGSSSGSSSCGGCSKSSCSGCSCH